MQQHDDEHQRVLTGQAQGADRAAEPEPESRRSCPPVTIAAIAASAADTNATSSTDFWIRPSKKMAGA